MADQEQHELAALAAGITDYKYIEPELAKRIINDRGLYVWQPKDDDGDAFRLMVKLGLTPIVDTVWYHETEIDGTGIAAPHKGDPLAATRLAIFNAAVEKGSEIRKRQGLKP